MQISVNGELVDVASGTTLAQLLESMKLAGKRIALERNGEIVPRSAYAGTLTAAGDRIEIVQAIGGG